MNRQSRGFTLIELMIVVAIIAVLVSVALPLFVRQQARAAEGACLAETKNYVHLSLAAILSDTAPLPAPLAACSSADNIVAASTTITGTPKRPGTRRTICDMQNANCTLER